jgi:hypothetical protein
MVCYRENFTFTIKVLFEVVIQVTTVCCSYCFFTDDSMSAGTLDSEEEAMKTLRTKKSFLERESEIVMKALLASSSDDIDTGKENHSLDLVWCTVFQSQQYQYAIACLRNTQN